MGYGSSNGKLLCKTECVYQAMKFNNLQDTYDNYLQDDFELPLCHEQDSYYPGTKVIIGKRVWYAYSDYQQQLNEVQKHFNATDQGVHIKSVDIETKARLQLGDSSFPPKHVLFPESKGTIDRIGDDIAEWFSSKRAETEENNTEIYAAWRNSYEDDTISVT